ncbi:type II toxin-antitoxin system PemK/MazF family toxin [Gemmatimonas sp.]|uniref:type II toxin-antitoxin system PemK/MazF family toxin n=1 Tax=Gemmatimonas sp. TaxID=1962908 RepID=UPI00356AB430
MVTPANVRRGDVFLVQLDPTHGGEIRKSRPCVVVSPDDLNAHVRTVIVAPLTKGGHAYPFRVPCRFGGKDGSVVVDQVRAVDVERFSKRLGRLSPATLARSLEVLQAMFAA